MNCLRTNMRLQGKIAIVTGGLSGIGQAIALRMADEGAFVIAADLNTKKTVLDSGTLVPLYVDVSDAESVDAMIRAVVTHYGGLDCLIHSAGIGRDLPFFETTIEVFDQMIAVNLRGSFLVGQAAARAMKRTCRGSIVNIASVSGIVGNAGRSAYAASKGGVIALSRAMAVDLAAFKIRVNVIAPGPIETPLVERLHVQELRGNWIDRTPMHRYGQPDEIAGAAVFLCSNDASYITGHVLAVDGGILASGLNPSWDSGARRVSDKTFRRSKEAAAEQFVK